MFTNSKYLKVYPLDIVSLYTWFIKISLGVSHTAVERVAYQLSNPKRQF